VSGRSADAALARSQAAVAAAESEQARRSVEAAAKVDLLNAHSRHSQWQRLSQASAQAGAAADAIGRAYEAGELGMAELLAARRQQLDARLEAATASLDAHEALARLRLDAHQVWAPGHEEGGGHHHDH
jgi:outer membrane protein TolC